MKPFLRQLWGFLAKTCFTDALTRVAKWTLVYEETLTFPQSNETHFRSLMFTRITYWPPRSCRHCLWHISNCELENVFRCSFSFAAKWQFAFQEKMLGSSHRHVSVVCLLFISLYHLACGANLKDEPAMKPLLLKVLVHCCKCTSFQTIYGIAKSCKVVTLLSWFLFCSQTRVFVSSVDFVNLCIGEYSVT